MKRTVKDLMRQRNISRMPCLDQSATIEEALIALEEFDSGSLLVVHDGQPKGVFSERDFTRGALESNGFVALNQPIGSLMNDKIVIVNPEYRLEECMAIMTQLKTQHLLVVDQGTAVAFLNMRHILEALIEDRSFMVDELTKYITGAVRLDNTEDKPPRAKPPGATTGTWR
ncbi:MAG: CBS domain-containing protein [Calothrix sp. SM1_5_4]|nr:CBS domain-containing protein [Calothrix sp. SM1_5_4]